MNKREKTQQTRFDKQISPLIKELTELCDKFDMPMVFSVQLYENNDTGARVASVITHPQSMSLQMALSSSILNGTTQVKLDKDNKLRLTIDKNDLPDDLQPVANFVEDKIKDETFFEHAQHCEDCSALAEEAVLNGASNVEVPTHAGMNLRDLFKEIKQSKATFIIPKNKIIH